MRTRTIRGLAIGAAALLAGRMLGRRQASLANQVALITGGSRGLGLLLARELARRGCRLAICARDAAELDAARRDLERAGAEVVAMTCDVSRRDDVERLVADVSERLGGIDILVNNASIIQVGPLPTMTIEDFERAMAVNYWGGVYATMAVLPQMRGRRAGRIVNITSIGGKVAVPHLLPYDAAKFAMLGFSEGLRAELARDGVVVTTVVPGLMRTGSPVNALFKGDRAKELSWFVAGDTLPITSMSAERAARRIVAAAARGEAEVTLSWQAKVLRFVHDLFPGFTADLLGVVNRALPSAEQPVEALPGRSIGAGRPMRRLRGVAERLAQRYNQYGGRPHPA